MKPTKKERKVATLFAGSRLYARSVDEGAVFLHLIPHRRQERFQAEVGWSVNGRFPVELSSNEPIATPVNELLEAEWLIDFGELYHRKHGLGHLGWEVWRCSVEFDHPEFFRIFAEEDSASVSAAEARERAEAAVARCLQDLQEVALPYLEEWVQSRRASVKR